MNENRTAFEGMGAALPKRVSTCTLDSGAESKASGCVRPSIRIKRCAIKLLDTDNLHGSCKYLVDAICRAFLGSGDSELEVDIEITQQKVNHNKDIETIVEIEWDNP